MHIIVLQGSDRRVLPVTVMGHRRRGVKLLLARAPGLSSSAIVRVRIQNSIAKSLQYLH